MNNINIKNNNEWEVFTPSGWSNFDGIKQTLTDKIIKFTFSDNSILECTTNHKIKLLNGKFNESINLKINDILFNNLIIIKKETINKHKKVYDLLNVEKDNEYFTNNIISHNCGVGNWYHKRWLDADEGTNNFLPIKLEWFVHPDRDEKWKEERIRATSEREFEQEHGCSFLATGNTLIKGWKLKEIGALTKKPLYKSKDEKLWIWKKPEEEKQYLISVDTADSGGDGDFSAAHIIELENCEQVGEYKGHENPSRFGHLLVDLAIDYNNALLVVERNNLGPAVIQPALDRMYENLFYSQKGSLDFVDPNMNGKKMADEAFDKSKASVRPGFITSGKTRPLVIQKIDDFVNEDSVIINSSRTTSELLTFININGKYQAMSGYHDDLVMSLGIGLFIRDSAIKLQKLMNDIDNTRLDYMLTNNLHSTDNNIDNIKKKAMGNDFHLLYTNSNTQDPYKQKFDKNYEFNLRELLG